MPDDPKKIILFEQDHARKNTLKTILSQEGYLVFSFDAIANCLDNIDLLDAHLLILGSMVGNEALPILNALMAIQSRIPVLLISEGQKLRQVLDANQYDYAAIVDNSFDLAAFRAAVGNALDNGNTPGAMDFKSLVVGNCREMYKIKGKLAELGRLKESILITGERGVGKEAVARAIHHASGLDTSSFIKVDASQLNDDKGFSLLSALERSVPHLILSSGRAMEDRADRWTIYIKDIHALPGHLQAELLLMAGTDNHHIRFLTGTSQDMQKQVTDAFFREDLYYRLNVLQVKVPPLRHRRQDIPLLTDFFLYKYCREFDRVCLPLSSRLKELFQQYHWPGNVRELQEVVKRAITKGEQHIAFSTHYQGAAKQELFSNSSIRKTWSRELDSIDRIAREKQYLAQVGDKALKNICWDFMAGVEKRVMKRALESTNWNRKKAAAMLDISYKSMLNKIKEYKLA